MKAVPKNKWVVVSKDASKTRQPKSISFNLTDAYEVDLLNYAEDERHGNFSEFIKRLIALHRDGQRTPLQQISQNDPVEIDEDEKEAMGGFL